MVFLKSLFLLESVLHPTARKMFYKAKLRYSSAQNPSVASYYS